MRKNKKWRRSNAFQDTIEIKIPKKKASKFKPVTNYEQRKIDRAERVLGFILTIALTILLTAAIGTALFALYCFLFNQEALEKCKDLFDFLVVTISVSGAVVLWLTLAVVCILCFLDR